MFAKRVKRVLNKNRELKQNVDNVPLADAGNTPANLVYYGLTDGITQGDLRYQREGASIMFSSVDVRLELTANQTNMTDHDRIRILVLQAKDQYTPLPVDLFATTSNFLEPIRTDTGCRFTCLYDKIFGINEVDRFQKQLRLKFYGRRLPRKKCTWITSGAHGSAALYLVAFTEMTNESISIRACADVKFYDS